MKTLLLALALTCAWAVPVRADADLTDLVLYCTRCDPGNSVTPQGRGLCYDCSSIDPPGVPFITCGRCGLKGGRAAGCTQCQVIWPQP